MTTFYADPAYGGSGRTYDTSAWDAGAYNPEFFYALADVAAMANFMAAQSALAQAAAYTAVNAPGTMGTSTTSTLIGTGSKTITIQTGKAFAVGQYVVIARTSDAGNSFMLGRITAYNSGTGSLTVNVATVGGSGTFTDWTVSLAVDPAGAVGTSRQVATSGLATGGGNLSADRTITVPKAAGSDLRTGSDDTKALTSKAVMDAAASVALTDAATITPDFAAARNFHVALGGNRTLANPTNLIAGQSGRIRVVQDATGGRTLTFGTSFKKPGGSITLSTSANAVDLLTYFVHDATNIELGFVKGLA